MKDKDRWRRGLVEFFFPVENDRWLTVLRIGLGLQTILYCVSLKKDWSYLLSEGENGLISRKVGEVLISLESGLIPRLGWLVAGGARIGLEEGTVLTLVWSCLLGAGVLLVIGLVSRPAAVAAWFLHLCAVKSGDLVSYGMDNFTTIGLFYLMLSPLPDRWSLDWRWRGRRKQEGQLLGFFRRVLQIHLCLIYFFGGLAKCLGSGWWDGSNLWRALIRPPFNLISPDLLVQWKVVFPVAGIFICLLEISYPILIWPKTTRGFCLASVVLMHAGIGLSMGMYLFSLIMIILNLAAFGAEFLRFKEVSSVLPEQAGAT